MTWSHLDPLCHTHDDGRDEEHWHYLCEIVLDRDALRLQRCGDPPPRSDDPPEHSVVGEYHHQASGQPPRHPQHAQSGEKDEGTSPEEERLRALDLPCPLLDGDEVIAGDAQRHRP